MATFETQVEALTGISIDGSSNPTQTELSSFLVDGVKDVIHRMIEVKPGELARFTSTTNSTSSIAKVGTILSVVREHDSTTILRKCAAIDPGDRYDATDTESLNYRSKTSPGYYELAGSIHTVPAAGSGNNDIVVTQVFYDTGVAYGDEVPDNFPESYAYLVAIYASIQSLQAAMGDMSGNFSTAIGTTAVGAITTALGEVTSIVAAAKGKVTDYYTSIGDIDDTTELWDATNKRFSVIRDSLNQAQNLIDNNQPSGDYDAYQNLLDVNAALDGMQAHLADGETVLGAAPGSGDIYTALTAITTNVGLANAVIDVPPVPPDVPSAPSFSYANAADDTSIDSTIGAIPDLGGLASVPVYTPPAIDAEGGELVDLRAASSKVDFNDWFDQVGDYIETDEDVELAGAQLQKIGSYIGAYNAAMTNQLHEFNEANAQYQAEIKEHLQESANEVTRLTTVYNKASDINLQNAVRTYQTQVDEYTQKISRYSAEISEYNAEINEMNQRAQGYLNIAQAYSSEVQSRLSYSDAYQRASAARGAEGGARINQLNATVSVAAQELQRANVAIAEINTIMASYRLDIEGVAPYLQSAQQYIGQANGYVAEITARLQVDGTKYQWFQEQSVRLKTQYDSAFYTPGGEE